MNKFISLTLPRDAVARSNASKDLADRRGTSQYGSTVAAWAPMPDSVVRPVTDYCLCTEYTSTSRTHCIRITVIVFQLQEVPVFVYPRNTSSCLRNLFNLAYAAFSEPSLFFLSQEL
jgi:hypothetical protein